MPDLKISQLTEETTAADNELLSIVSSPAGTPITKKIQKQNLLIKPVTKVVAPSGTGGADYYTDGTADDVEIQAAIDALPSSGGRIIIKDGTFTLSARLLIQKNNITIEGQGAS